MTPEQFKKRQDFIGLSNKELGEGLGYTERHIRNLRNGKTQISKSVAMAMKVLSSEYKEDV